MYEIIAKILSQKFNKLENPQNPKERETNHSSDFIEYCSNS
jgi:hypothetical protein